MIISYHSNHGHIISSPTNAEPLKWRQAGLAAQIIVANQNADLRVRLSIIGRFMIIVLVDNHCGNQNADLQGRLSIIHDKNTKFRALITFDIAFDYI